MNLPLCTNQFILKFLRLILIRSIGYHNLGALLKKSHAKSSTYSASSTSNKSNFIFESHEIKLFGTSKLVYTR